MTKHLIAIVQNGYAIFGVGKTYAAAVKDANEWTDGADLRDLPGCSDTIGEFYWTRCTQKLANEVERRSGDIAWSELPDGTICTDAELD